MDSAMHVTLVQVQVKQNHVDDFITACRANHLASVQEAGNLRFDILQSVDDFTRFTLYEAYRDAAAAVAHKQTAHYAQWREQIAPWMAEPRIGLSYRGLFPKTER